MEIAQVVHLYKSVLDIVAAPLSSVLMDLTASERPSTSETLLKCFFGSFMKEIRPKLCFPAPERNMSRSVFYFSSPFGMFATAAA